MKIISPAVFAGLLATVVLGSGEAGASVRVVTSFYPLYVAALNVTEGVEGIEVHNMAAPHVGCLHDYQLTAADARQLADADLLVVNGAGMETFLEKIRAQSPRLTMVDASEGIPLLDGNPHVWVSPAGARAQVDNIARALSAVDPANAERYAANATAYNAQLTAFEARLKAELTPLEGAAVVAQHDSFPYLAQALGLVIVGVIENAHGHEPGAGQLARIIDLARDKNVRVIFSEPGFSARLAQTVARESGAPVVELDPVSAGPSEPLRARGGWLAAMEKNLAALRTLLR
ncbi:MAG: metal ABC transporter substrate-binding protein [Chthoniobacterales bacterium]|jgi:zinc transport system substrate-binding protein